jgi:4-amino-4-deoxy-L-arabinose transferase-like glycosyltransferase
MTPLNKKQTIALVVICLGLRLFFFMLVQPWKPEGRDTIIIRSEAKLFHNLGIGIKDRQEFGYEDTGELEALRMPGWPAFLAATYTIFGERPWVALLLQILLDTATCVLLLVIVGRYLGYGVGLGAALLYAVDPLLILLNSSLLTDLLFTFLLVVAFKFLSAGFQLKDDKGRTSRFALASFLFALATLARPVAQYVPIVMLVLFVMFYRRQWKLVLKYFVTVSVVFLVTISPWVARNQRAFDRAELSTSGPYGLLVLHVFPMVWKKHPDLSHREMKNQLLAEADTLMAQDGLNPRTANPFEKSDYWTRVGLEHIKSDPGGFVWSYLVGLYNLFGIIGARAYLNMLGHPGGMLRYAVAGIIALHLIVTYGSMIVGLIVAWRRHERMFLLVSLALALYFIILTGPAGISRYKVPAIPFYLVFSGVGLSYLIGRAQQLRNRRG